MSFPPLVLQFLVILNVCLFPSLRCESAKSQSPLKTRILVQGWINIPHSFALVNCFQLIHLLKNYGNKVDIYLDEQPYFNRDWYSIDDAQLYPEIYGDILASIKRWNSTVEVDIVYRISYPYDVSTWPKKNIPVIVFFSSSGLLYAGDFFNNGPSQGWSDNSTMDSTDPMTHKKIEDHLASVPNTQFVTGTAWSSNAIKPLLRDWEERVTVITHGGM